jgi:hypothetical protein
MTQEVDYWACNTGNHVGEPHTWLYRGKVAQTYTCRNCQLTVTKANLKEATD